MVWHTSLQGDYSSKHTIFSECVGPSLIFDFLFFFFIDTVCFKYSVWNVDTKAPGFAVSHVVAFRKLAYFLLLSHVNRAAPTF